VLRLCNKSDYFLRTEHCDANILNQVIFRLYGQAMRRQFRGCHSPRDPGTLLACVKLDAIAKEHSFPR
jgi:hypothetical protein